MEEKDNPKLYRFRHSLAHVLAQAVQKLYPGTQLGFGPPIETGFYYDFDFASQVVSEQDLKKIEKEMRKILGQKQLFERENMGVDEALAQAKSSGQVYKIENIQNLKDRGVKEFSYYKNGPFSDLCEGPHVEHTGELTTAGFKLDRIAGAYWLGDEKNKMLTRIYALAFESEAELDSFLKRRARALEFDHKKLGKELELFHFDDYVGKGLPLWLPNGTIIRDEVESYAKEMEFQWGYKRVSTPVLAKQELYLRSQHLPAYEESMFPPITCDHGETGHTEKFYLRPMNCPHHHLVYGSSLRSYKELPLRLAEYGNTFRYEQSGELAGLLRVRGMTMNDAHIYLRLDQIEEEIENTLRLYQALYATFKLKEFTFRLSVRDDKHRHKYRGDDESWNTAETLLRKVLEKTGTPYFVGEGEAAFYGPKIDIQFKNLMGREETVSTIQVDFLAAINFDLKYIDETGKEARPVVIHRAPLSTHERFISFLIEYYGGAFPTWLAPVQVVVMPVKETCYEYAQALSKELFGHRVRVEVDDSSNSFGKKIRTHTVRKVPVILIVGEQETSQGTVTVRRYGVEQQETLNRGEFVTQLLAEIRERKNFREPMGSIV